MTCHPLCILRRDPCCSWSGRAERSGFPWRGPNLMESSSDKATAYHEAGHAVMALALGRPVAGVSVRAAREHLGICEFGKAVFRPSEDWLEREILISLAGLAAEARHTGEYSWDAASRDNDYAEDLARQRAG